ncbi:MAG TPA: hypothetical protein VFG69_06130 [Nannocystaceae bacterium]|nr:hypothetical protein [Nannocystaceae bacterium]
MPRPILPRLSILLLTSAFVACDPDSDPDDPRANLDDDDDDVRAGPAGPSTIAAPADPIADLPNCCEGHATPGCESAAIEACVCAADAFCCDTRWDNICAGEVESLGCGSCTEPSCCETATGPGCGDADVEACVCAADPYCCATAWDSLCVTEVESLDCGTCTPASCCETHGPGCGDPDVEECVCDADPYCCATGWDALCVSDVESLDCGSCGPACGTDTQVAAILAAFEPCAGAQLGQTSGVAGVTCEQICCAFGFEGCEYRGAQADYDACNPSPAPATGSCSDVFQASWSSQCVCTN